MYRLGHTQRKIVTYLNEKGAASSWDLAKLVRTSRNRPCPTVTQPALWRLKSRQLVKRQDRHEPVTDLSPSELSRFQNAMRRQPRAFAFWVLSDELADSLTD